MKKRVLLSILAVVLGISVSAQQGNSPVPSGQLSFSVKPLGAERHSHPMSEGKKMPVAKSASVLASFDFDQEGVGYTLGVVSEGMTVDGHLLVPHTQSATAPAWQYVDSLAAMNSDEFVANNQNFSTLGWAQFIRNGLTYTWGDSTDNGFLLMHLADASENGVVHAYVELSPIDASGASQLEVRFSEAYAKWYDTCYLDFTDSMGNWHSMELNIAQQEVSINYLLYGARYVVLPSMAAHDNLKLRFRWLATGPVDNRYGFFWALDHVIVSSQDAFRMEVVQDRYLEGVFGIVPRGMKLPLSRQTIVRNIGTGSQHGVTSSVHQLIVTEATDGSTQYTGGTSYQSQLDSIGGMFGGGYYWQQPQYDLSIVGSPLTADMTYSGWYGFSGTYATNSSVMYNTGMPADSVGMGYSFYSSLNSQEQNNMGNYTWRNYRVSAPADSLYVWAKDNGYLYDNYEYTIGYTTSDYRNLGYNGFYNQAGYYTSVRYTTGPTIPTDVQGRPWVVRGIELVAARTEEASQYVGAKLSAKLTKDVYTPDGNRVNYVPLPCGAAQYTVSSADINLLPAEGQQSSYTDYNTIRILFPEQTELEPNTSYRAGYTLDESHEFAVASDNSWPKSYNDYDVLTGDMAVTFFSGLYFDPQPQIRLLVGPRTASEVQHTVHITTDDGGQSGWDGIYPYLSADTTFNVAEGSSHSIYFTPDSIWTAATVTVDGTTDYASVGARLIENSVNLDGTITYRLLFDSIVANHEVHVIFTDTACANTYTLPYTANFNCWTAEGGATIVDAGHASFATSGMLVSPWISVPQGVVDYAIAYTGTGEDYFSLPIKMEYEYGGWVTNRIGIGPGNGSYSGAMNNANTGMSRVRFILGEYSDVPTSFVINGFRVYSYPVTLALQAPRAAHVGDTVTLEAAVLPTGTGSWNWEWSVYSEQSDALSESDTSMVSVADTGRTLVFHTPGKYYVWVSIQRYVAEIGYFLSRYAFSEIDIIDSSSMDCENITLPYTADFSQCWTTVGESSIDDAGSATLFGGWQSMVLSPWFTVPDNNSLYVLYTMMVDNPNGSTDYAEFDYSIPHYVGLEKQNGEIVRLEWQDQMATRRDFRQFLADNLAGETVRVIFRSYSSYPTHITSLRIFQFPFESSIVAVDTAIVGQPVTLQAQVNVAGTNVADYYYWNINNDAGQWVNNQIGLPNENNYQSEVSVSFQTEGTYHISLYMEKWNVYEGWYLPKWARKSIVVVNQEVVGIEQNEAATLHVYVEGKAIVVRGNEGAPLQILDVLGRVVISKRYSGIEERFVMPTAGVYLLKIDGVPAHRIVLR